MYCFLKAHPEIFFSPLKETHYFGRDLQRNKPKRIKDQKYFSFFRGAKNEKWVGEASTWYLSSTEAAIEIKQFSPEARILIMLRHPVETMYSLHSQNLFNGIEPVTDFEKALALEPDRTEAWMRGDPDSNPRLRYRLAVHYAEQVERYFDVFGRNHVHVIFYDDFKRDVASSYRSTLEFLNVDADFTPSFKVINANKEPRIVWLRDLLLQPPDWIHKIACMLLPEFTTRRCFHRKIVTLNSKWTARPTMDPVLHDRLAAELAPEVDALEALIGRDLSDWRQ